MPVLEKKIAKEHHKRMRVKEKVYRGEKVHECRKKVYGGTNSMYDKRYKMRVRYKIKLHKSRSV